LFYCVFVKFPVFPRTDETTSDTVYCLLYNCCILLVW